MGKGSKRRGDRKDQDSTQGTKVEQKQLWHINEVIINENYSLETTEGGETRYTLFTSRPDLPEMFWYQDWYAMFHASWDVARNCSTGSTPCKTGITLKSWCSHLVTKPSKAEAWKMDSSSLSKLPVTQIWIYWTPLLRRHRRHARVEKSNNVQMNICRKYAGNGINKEWAMNDEVCLVCRDESHRMGPSRGVC